VFGLRQSAAMTAGQIASAAADAGLAEVEVTLCGYRVIAPALRLAAARLSGVPAAPAGQRAAARALLRQVELLWRRCIIDYMLLLASRDPALMRSPVPATPPDDRPSPDRPGHP
jgi:hypothetical protein